MQSFLCIHEPIRRKYMKKKWIIILLIIIAVAVGGGYFWYQKSHAPQKDNYTVGAVSRGTIGLTIDATGTIEPVNSVDLSATARRRAAK